MIIWFFDHLLYKELNMKKNKSLILYVLKRLIETIPVALTVAIFIFVILRLAPGDPAAVLAGDTATTQDIEKIRESLGLNDPIYLQLIHWLGNLLQGDLGNSVFAKVPVTTLIGQRIYPTIYLTITAIITTVLMAIPLGTIAAWKAGKWPDRVISVFCVAGYSMPAFLIGYIIIYIFSIQLDWFPVQGYSDPFKDGLFLFIQKITLPTLALSLVLMALITRMTRSSILDILHEDYIRTARAKGRGEASVLIKHALPAAAVPIVTTVGLALAVLIGGVVVTETVFNIPGLGRLVLDAITSRDFPVIQGLILFFSFLYIFINLLIDLSYPFFDPRIRL